MALGVAPVEHYFIHGYWIGEGGVKMSKSLGNVVDPAEVVRLLGVDALRFYLINNMTLGGDSQISVAMLKQGYKMLANNIGNLQMRVLKMVQKSLEGKVPFAGRSERRGQSAGQRYCRPLRAYFRSGNVA